MPAGQYTLRVNLYGGSTNVPFVVRIVRNGTVITKTGTVTQTNSGDDVTKMIDIDTFTIN